MLPAGARSAAVFRRHVVRIVASFSCAKSAFFADFMTKVRVEIVRIVTIECLRTCGQIFPDVLREFGAFPATLCSGQNTG